MRYRRLVPALSIVAPGAVAGGGGGSNTVRVEGKMLKGGSQYPSGKIRSSPSSPSFRRTHRASRLGAATCTRPKIGQETDDLEVPGPDRRGLRPGKYRVAVTQEPKHAGYDAASQKARKASESLDRDTDRLNDQSGTFASPIRCEVKNPGGLAIDVDRPTAARSGRCP